jgi:hypothetical protein
VPGFCKLSGVNARARILQIAWATPGTGDMRRRRYRHSQNTIVSSLFRFAWLRICRATDLPWDPRNQVAERPVRSTNSRSIDMPPGDLIAPPELT